MINEENLNKIYDSIIEGNELTTKRLNSYGFNSRDITTLINRKKIRRIKRGYYTFLSSNDLVLYGKKLISLKKYNEAETCFEKSYEISPNAFEICLQLFLREIKLKNYSEAFKYFDCLYKNSNSYCIKDNNFYLYLLNMITEVPEKYKECIRTLTFDDIKLNIKDTKLKNPSLQNKIRLTAYNRYFSLASRQLNDLVKQEKLSISNLIISILLEQAFTEQHLVIDKKLELIKNKQYQEFINYLEQLQKRYKLNSADKYALILAKDLVDIIDGKIPKQQSISCNNIFKAIDSKNYEQALKFSKVRLKKENQDFGKNIIHILLLEITKILSKKGMNKSNQNYAINNIKAIASLMLSKPEIEEVCKKFNLNDEQKCIVLLILAKDLYLQGDILSGDKYLKQAEKIKSTSKKIKDLLEEIRKNKKLYKSITKKETKQLVLKQGGIKNDK